MLILLFQLLLVRITICDETSSFLSNVLTKIQRERLGQLDEEFESYNDNDNQASESNDYFYINDANDVSDDTFKDYQGDPYHTQETKTKPHYESISSLPTNDLIYIYNDTIYLYKAPNISGHTKPGNQDETNSDGKMKYAMIPHKMKIKNPRPFGTVDVTNPEDLINIVFTDDEENHDMTAAPPEGDNEEIEGYYYQYYPIDQLPPEMANLVMTMGSKGRPIKPGMVIKPSKKPMMPMKPGMPMKPVMMMKKKKRPVGPLFKAMAVFVGTAVVFIATILLLPRVKLVKAKSTGLNYLQIDDDEETWDQWGSH